jgi:hypothetical protein
VNCARTKLKLILTVYYVTVFQYGEVTREARLASEKFIEAANAISDKRTIDALMLLAENYEYRAHAAHAKIPERADEKKKESALTDDEGVSPATRGEVGLNGKKTPITMAVGGREPMKVQGTEAAFGFCSWGCC